MTRWSLRAVPTDRKPRESSFKNTMRLWAPNIAEGPRAIWCRTAHTILLVLNPQLELIHEARVILLERSVSRSTIICRPYGKIFLKCLLPSVLTNRHSRSFKNMVATGRSDTCIVLRFMRTFRLISVSDVCLQNHIVRDTVGSSEEMLLLLKLHQDSTFQLSFHLFSNCSLEQTSSWRIMNASIAAIRGVKHTYSQLVRNSQDKRHISY